MPLKLSLGLSKTLGLPAYSAMAPSYSGAASGKGASPRSGGWRYEPEPFIKERKWDGLGTPPLVPRRRPISILDAHLSRVVITTFGSLGDLHPYLAIALELQHRGHEAIVATAGCHRQYVESRGLGFRPVRSDSSG